MSSSFISRSELPHHRLFEFAKTALIKIFVSPYATISLFLFPSSSSSFVAALFTRDIDGLLFLSRSVICIAGVESTSTNGTKPKSRRSGDVGEPEKALHCTFLRVRSLTKYQKNVEASHNKGGGMKPNTVPNCIRSENYVITFEIEEEKY
ncbi:LOW QUALITY PROTEIN: mRNA cap guanine-N7 methyltransferase 2 isoform X3 [Cinnamomum micranthum f. kanehirae]|uniref:mRNA cap guanine-N7 methyltransferase 2 isoform X3 n=1 Tax=Cinnamomum micranthum f. kanehirae TaxID=337451 RepID=A0A3S3QD68_9MAGN|nr:LOW QUALITY PROTEIN: mRNA cap guanine-N7 methyltransferase 2 isoform X3 [Cinnamomum micranthum f. kanehirae]